MLSLLNSTHAIIRRLGWSRAELLILVLHSQHGFMRFRRCTGKQLWILPVPAPAPCPRPPVDDRLCIWSWPNLVIWISLVTISRKIMSNNTIISSSNAHSSDTVRVRVGRKQWFRSRSTERGAAEANSLTFMEDEYILWVTRQQRGELFCSSVKIPISIYNHKASQTTFIV